MTRLPAHIIIVAGGSGTRFGTELPKQFVEIAGCPVLLLAVRSVRAALPEAALTVVLAPQWMDYFSTLCAKFGDAVPLLAAGGATRWESVRNGLATVSADAGVVLVHDGARPFPSMEVIYDAVSAIEGGAQGAVPAVPVTDSIRCIAEYSMTSEAVDRMRLRAVQTPQAFRADLLREAYTLPYRDTFTDDASVMEAAGYRDIRLTEGSPYNIKITNPGDIAVAEAYLESGLI